MGSPFRKFVVPSSGSSTQANAGIVWCEFGFSSPTIP